MKLSRATRRILAKCPKNGSSKPKRTSRFSPILRKPPPIPLIWIFTTRYLQEQGHLGLPSMCLPRTNIQHLFVVLAGVTNTIFLLADYPDTVEAYFRALSKSQEGMLEAVGDSPLEWINYGDNLHCKILPPDLYRKYILPEYEKRGDILHKKGKIRIFPLGWGRQGHPAICPGQRARRHRGHNARPAGRRDLGGGQESAGR